jgi:hypothetical protein
MNGTGAKMLRDGYDSAVDAVMAAEDAMKRIEFNARDYYVDGPEKWSAARDEFADMMENLQRVRMKLEGVVLHIDRSTRK